MHLHSAKGMTKAQAKAWRDILEPIAALIAGDYEAHRLYPRRGTRWPSAAHALTDMVWTDIGGYRTGSVANPERIKRLMAHCWEWGRDKGGGTSSQVIDLDPVRKAWRLAYSGPWGLIPEDVCRKVCLFRYVGKRPISELAAVVSLGLRCRVGPKYLGNVARVGLGNVHEYLLERELVPGIR